MTRSGTKQQGHSWPVITVELDGGGGGVVSVAGVQTRVAGADIDGARTAAIGVLVGTATRLGRPVRAATSSPDGRFEIVIHQDGTVLDAAPPRRGSARVRRVRAAKTASPGAAALTDGEGAGSGEVEVPPTGRPISHPRPPCIAEPPAAAAQPVGDRAATLEDGTDEQGSPKPSLAVSPATDGTRRLWWLAVAAVAAAVGFWTVHDGQVRDVALQAASTRAVASQRQALDEQSWITGRQVVARDAASAAVRAQHVAAARAEISRAGEVLAASAGQVDDEAARDRLSAAIDAASSALDSGASAASWQLRVTEMAARTAAVQGAQATWQARQASVVEVPATPPVAAASPAQPAPRASHAPAAPSASAAAPVGPAAGSPAPVAGALSTIRAVLSSGAGTVSFTVTVTSSGPVSTTVSVSVAGHQVAMSGPGTVDGTATFTGSTSGLPAGTQKWTATASGLSTSGQIEVF